MDTSDIRRIIKEELSEAEQRIMRRLYQKAPKGAELEYGLRRPLPENENYGRALALYSVGGTHSGTARALGVSMAQGKKYYTWLVKHGYLPTEQAELSAAEKQVADCIFGEKLSLRETAKRLNCSVSNVAYRRDSALRKGFCPGNRTIGETE